MITAQDRSIYLASRSPRRRELLAQIGVRFHLLLFRDAARTADPDVDEDPLPGEAPDAYVRAPRALEGRGRLAAHAAAQPAARAGARRGHHRRARRRASSASPPTARRPPRCSRALSGRSHEVLTAVALKHDDRIESALSRSEVRFKTLVREEIRAVRRAPASATTRPAPTPSRAAPARFVVELRGSYSGVMGLPLYETGAAARRARRSSAVALARDDARRSSSTSRRRRRASR